MSDIDSLRTKMLHDIENELQKRGIQVIVREESGVLQLPDEILFDHNEFTLNDDGLNAIGKLAEVLDEILPCYSIVPESLQDPCYQQSSTQLRLEAVFIEGHTDSVGDDPYNWELSVDRAINTFQELEQRSQLATELLNDEGEYLFSVAGYGEKRLLVVEVTEDDKRRNRRIDLRFVMNVSHQEALDRVQRRLQDVLELP